MMAGRAFLVLTGACQFGHGLGGFTCGVYGGFYSFTSFAGARSKTPTWGASLLKCDPGRGGSAQCRRTTRSVVHRAIHHQFLWRFRRLTYHHQVRPGWNPGLVWSGVLSNQKPRFARSSNTPRVTPARTIARSDLPFACTGVPDQTNPDSARYVNGSGGTAHVTAPTAVRAAPRIWPVPPPHQPCS